MPGVRQCWPLWRPYRCVLPAAHRQQTDRGADRGRRKTGGGQAGNGAARQAGHDQAAPADITASRNRHAGLVGPDGTAAGDGTDGGHAKLHTRTTPVRLQKQGNGGAGPGGSQSGLPALLPDPRIAGMWHIDNGVDIPAFDEWPLSKIR